jgi:hypothetical protein
MPGARSFPLRDEKMNLLKRLWADPVWSKVISSLILAIPAGALIRWWSHCVTTVVAGWEFLIETTLVANWLLITLALGTLGFIIIVIIAFTENRSTPSLSWTAYVLDTFDDIRWRWRYGVDGAIHDVCPFCPRCDMQINPHMLPYLNEYRTIFRCDSCGFERQIDGGLHEIEHLIKRYIQKNSVTTHGGSHLCSMKLRKYSKCLARIVPAQTCGPHMLK